MNSRTPDPGPASPPQPRFIRRLISSIKHRLLPEGVRPCRILGGVARGCRMRINLHDRAQRWLGLEEREILEPVRRLMRTSRSLVDVGANNGFYTVAFLASKADRVVACEGGDAVAELEDNARLNGHRVGDRFSVVHAMIGGDGSCTPLHEILRDLPHPVLVKIDVDGGEVDVLQSAEKHPRLGEVSWVVEVHSPELENGCLAWFREHGFKTRVIPNAWWRAILPEQRDIPHNRWIEAVPASS